MLVARLLLRLIDFTAPLLCGMREVGNILAFYVYATTRIRQWIVFTNVHRSRHLRIEVHLFLSNVMESNYDVRFSFAGSGRQVGNYMYCVGRHDEGNLIVGAYIDYRYLNSISWG